MDEQPEEENEEYKDIMKEVEDLKKSKLGINSTTEALLVLIYQTLDSIRFQTSD